MNNFWETIWDIFCAVIAVVYMIYGLLILLEFAKPPSYNTVAGFAVVGFAALVRLNLKQDKE